MNRSRRTFLAGAGATFSSGVLAASGSSATAEVPARPATNDAPRGLTFATIRRGHELSLAIKTERGLLDVRTAETANRRGFIDMLRRLVAEFPAAEEGARKEGGDEPPRSSLIVP